MIGAVLLGYNVINILASALATEVHRPRSCPAPGAWPSPPAVMTVLVLVFVEVLPKTLAIVRADDVARVLSGPIAAGRAGAGADRSTRSSGSCGTPCACSACGWTWRPTCWPPTRRSAARSSTTTPKALVESRDRRMLGGVLDLSRDGRRRGHGPPQADLHARRRPAAARDLVAEVLESAHTRLPLYRGRSGEHRRRAARQGPAARHGRGRRQARRARHRRRSPASPGSSPRPPT